MRGPLQPHGGCGHRRDLAVPGLAVGPPRRAPQGWAAGDAGPDRKIEENELGKLRAAIGEKAYAQGRYDEAGEFFEHVALGREFIEFLTLPAYERIGL